MLSWVDRYRGKLLTIFVAVGVLLGLCFFIPIYLVWGNSNFICFSTPFPSYQSVEERAYLRFPASARNIEFYANGVNRKAGCTIWVKFEMDSSDLDTFIASTYVENLSSSAQLEGDAFEFFSAERGWSQPLNF